MSLYVRIYNEHLLELRIHVQIGNLPFHFYCPNPKSFINKCESLTRVGSLFSLHS